MLAIILLLGESTLRTVLHCGGPNVVHRIMAYPVLS